MSDLINRKSALKALRPIMRKSDYYYEILKAIQDIPPAEPERKKGRWIKVNGKTAINCSACYHCSWSLLFEDTVKQFNFCPNCGADMRGEQNDIR